MRKIEDAKGIIRTRKSTDKGQIIQWQSENRIDNGLHNNTQKIKELLCGIGIGAPRLVQVIYSFLPGFMRFNFFSD